MPYFSGHNYYYPFFMNLNKRSSAIALFCALFYVLPAQNIVITYSESDSLFVCRPDTFTVHVQNNNATPLSGATLTATLPPGLSYVAGAVSGANEQNISDLSAPVFSFDVPANQSITVKILLSAPCAAADSLDAGQLFVVNLLVATALGNAQLLTDPIPVNTGAIFIESLSGQFLMGEREDTLLRTICIKNTRPGQIGNLYFEDTHLAGFDVSVLGATNQSNGVTLFSADFDGSLFSQVGNHDPWLDQNESVCFTERIIITSCGEPAFTNNSTLKVGWGCGGAICRYVTTQAFIDIKPSTNIPDLVFEQIWAPPTDYCGSTPAVMGYKIKNIGRANANNVTFNVTLTNGLAQTAMGASSFRLKTATGSTPIIPNLSTPTVLAACGFAGVREGSFVIPQVPAYDSLEFLFDVFTCTAECQQVQPIFRADYFYQKACPVGGFVSGNKLIVSEEGYEVKGRLKSLIGNCLEPGLSYPFSYEALGKYLLEDGFWHLKLNLPLGITLDNSCGVLLGADAPVLYETTPLSGGGQNVHLAWATPLPLDSLRMNFCLHFECDTNIVCLDETPDPDGGVIYTELCCFIAMSDATYWSPALNTLQACAISVCHDNILGVNLICSDSIDVASGDSTHMVPIIPTPGLRDWWTAYRLNLGFHDATDDRDADLPLASPGILARRDRFLAGDTLRVEYCGVMDSVGSVDTISRAIWHEIVGSDMGMNDNDLFSTIEAKQGFVDSSKVRLINTRIRVRYANGTEAFCNWNEQYFVEDKNYFKVVNPNSFPAQALDDIATERFSFLFSLPKMFAMGCLPKPALELGDSIFILSDFKIDVNFKPISSNIPDPPLVGFRTASSAGGLVYAWNIQPHVNLQYSGWRKQLSRNTHSIKPCENSVEASKFRYSMRIARENMFPFEVRPLASISDYRQTVPPGLELASARLEYLTLQDSVPFLNNLPLPFSQSGGLLDLDFTPAFSKPVDEGFTLRSNLIFKPNCLFTAPDTSIQYIETSFTGCINGMDSVVLDSIKNTIGFYSNAPKLSLLTGDSILYSPTRIFDIDFVIKNTLATVSTAAWIAVVSPSGQAGGFQLFDMPQNQPVAGVNGLFNIGNVSTPRGFQLTGESLACTGDSLLIIYGWGCSPISSLAESDCGRDSFWIQIHLEHPELDLSIAPEPSTLMLCDTSDWFEFTIFNAKEGNAYNVEASIKLPPGLRIVSGNCQISYPDGSAWDPIPDPMLLTGNLFQWQINDLLPALVANGLPAQNNSETDAFSIRFKVLAECGFVSNTPIIYGTTGIEPCGRQANVLNKAGEPLTINGLSPSYGVQIGIQPNGGLQDVCGAIQEYTVVLDISGTPSVGDSVYISLPQGVVFLANSYSPGLNAPAGPVTLNAQGFQLPLPGLSGGGKVEFSFFVQYESTAGCNDQTLLVQTRVKSQAFCQSLGAPCDVYVSTGVGTWNVNPTHPEFMLTNADLSISNGQMKLTLIVLNTGTIEVNGITAMVWQDLDGDGAVSANDVLLATLQNVITIEPNGYAYLHGTLSGIDSTQLCNLLFVLPALENCICEDQVYALNNLSLKHTELIYCALNPVTLGVPLQQGYTYQWQPGASVSCATCPSTTYTPDPNTPPNTPQTLVLTESSNGCKVTHTFQVSFGAAAQIVVGNSPICEGKTSTLSAAPSGASYTWQGPGIQDPSQQMQTIQSAVTSTYTVVVSFPNGCTASAAVEIEVLQSDTMQLAELVTCVGDSIEIFDLPGTKTATAGTYQLLLPKSNGCDSVLLRTLTVLPKALSEEEQVFCFGDSLLVFDSLFTASGEIIRVFPNASANGCDSTHVVTVLEKVPVFLTPPDTIFGNYGQIITLTGPDGFTSYHWEPMPTPPCPNCASVTYTADSSGYQEYLLTVAGVDGCPAELLFRVLVFPPCSADSLKIPNAFTPNGDGNNDVFRVVAHEGAEVVSSMEIYDRWGAKVYENRGDSAWDGTINGKPAPSDVYVYIVKVTCGELIGKRVGDVTLLR